MQVSKGVSPFQLVGVHDRDCNSSEDEENEIKGNLPVPDLSPSGLCSPRTLTNIRTSSQTTGEEEGIQQACIIHLFFYYVTFFSGTIGGCG